MAAVFAVGLMYAGFALSNDYQELVYRAAADDYEAILNRGRWSSVFNLWSGTFAGATVILLGSGAWSAVPRAVRVLLIAIASLAVMVTLLRLIPARLVISTG